MAWDQISGYFQKTKGQGMTGPAQVENDFDAVKLLESHPIALS